MITSNNSCFFLLFFLPFCSLNRVYFHRCVQRAHSKPSRNVGKRLSDQNTVCVCVSLCCSVCISSILLAHFITSGSNINCAIELAWSPDIGLGHDGLVSSVYVALWMHLYLCAFHCILSLLRLVFPVKWHASIFLCIAGK